MTGVTLNEKHCTRDLGLYLTDAVIAAPEVQTSYASVPGGDGYLDLSTALDGEIHYKGREIKLSFETSRRFAGKNWPELLAQFYELVHGQSLKLCFDEDPDWYYTGRGTATDFTRSGEKLTLKASVYCQPYKIRKTVSSAASTLTTADKVLTLINQGRKVTPTVEVTAETKITWQGSSIALSAGTHTVASIRIPTGRSTLSARTTSGTGEITLRWNEVML